MKRRHWLYMASCFVAMAIGPPAVAWLRFAADTGGRGTASAPLPPWGEGFSTHSTLGSAAGRQYVDRGVREVVVAAFRERSRSEPGRRFIVGETGWPGGGPFWPHRSHRNGRSVDVFMPVNTRDGRPATVPCWPWTAYGYSVEFDRSGRGGELAIDFDSAAALILEFDAQARPRGLRVARVIIAPEYVPLLLQTKHGAQLGRLGERLSRRPAWVRHDEHLHVDLE